MSGRDPFDIAWDEFVAILEREKARPVEERGKAALRAAFRAMAPDQLLEKRAEETIDAIAAKHGTTGTAVRSSSQAAVNVVAREEAAVELVAAGVRWRKVAELLGRKASSQVAIWIANHKARVAGEAAGGKEFGNVG